MCTLTYVIINVQYFAFQLRVLADFVVGFVSDVEDATPSAPVIDLTMPELMSADEGKDAVEDSVKAAGGGQLQQQEFDARTVLNRFVLGRAL